MRLPKYIPLLPSDSLSIITSYSIDTLKKLKQRREQVKSRTPTLYIANTDLKLPLKNNVIDYVIDSFSFNGFTLFNNSFPLPLLSKYLKESKIIGSYVYYNNIRPLKR
ncbi:hypothetical protein [Siminovitchia terrae]|uniref:hypothetical protein n=1 Tax=Siminovitchia terrae TaxID=1914933 RepID=UPI001BB3173A|nr:hypothetical protein [Siminovitchia terrae]